MNYKPLFSRALGLDPERLHFAAHSHHLWPDVSFDGQVQAWAEANRFASILGEQDAMRREKAELDQDAEAAAREAEILAARVAAWDPDRLARTADAEAKWAEAGVYGYSARDRDHRLARSMEREIQRQCEREKYRAVDREYE